MTPSGEGSRTPPSSAVAADAHGLAAAMDGAFEPLGEEEGGDKSVVVEVDSALLGSVPSPAPLDFESLEREATHQRRLVIRAAVGIPIAGVLAVGGSLLIHAILVGAFAVSFFAFLHVPQRGGGSATADDLEAGGGIPGGTLFVTDAPEVAPGKEEKLARGPVAPMPAVPPLKEAPAPPAQKPPTVAPIAPSVPPQQLAMNIHPPLPNTPEIIGVPAQPDEIGALHLPAPAPAQVPPAPPPAPVEVGLPIMAPPQTAILASPVTSKGTVQALGASLGTAAHTRSPRAGPDDGMGDDDDEDTISLLNPGHGGGEGTGRGKHHGNGIDRGPSGGDNDTPGVLDPPSFQLPAQYEFHPPKQRVILSVTVLANGRVGDIRIKQSCGIPDVDEAYKSLVANEYKFRPAYRDGKPFAATIDCSQSFSADDQ